MSEKPASWLQITFRIQTTDLEPAETVLQQCGALSITLKDAGDQPLLEPLPGETPLWDCCIVSALFMLPEFPEKLENHLKSTLEPLNPDNFHSEHLAEQAWERVWMRDFKPMRFGKRLWICPSHLAPPEPAAINLKLDPGLAFGTGTHPTTALCLEWLDDHSLKNKTIIDYGCGSGILAIAAALLGAKRVYAVDLDPQALSATKANANTNGVMDKLDILHSENTDKLKQADIVFANILTNTLIALSDTLHANLAKGGQLIMSGILSEQIESIQHCYSRKLKLQPPIIKDGWALIEGQK